MYDSADANYHIGNVWRSLLLTESKRLMQQATLLWNEGTCVSYISATLTHNLPGHFIANLTSIHNGSNNFLLNWIDVIGIESEPGMLLLVLQHQDISSHNDDQHVVTPSAVSSCWWVIVNQLTLIITSSETNMVRLLDTPYTTKQLAHTKTKLPVDVFWCPRVWKTLTQITQNIQDTVPDVLIHFYDGQT